jgi:hypothetical protein
VPSGHRPPIPPGYARVALLGTIFGHAWTQVFYLALTGSGIVAADLNTLATDLANSWNTNIAPVSTGDSILTGVEIVYIPSVGNEVVGSATVSHAGSNAGSSIADASACAVVNWNISAYYRGGHPRTYQPGILGSVITNGSIISSGQRSSIATGWANFRTAVNAYTTTNISGVSMGTMSFQTGNSWRTPPIFRAYTGCSVRTVLGSQRRRLKS